ncbi:hypothetical protein ACFL0M_00605 [Thermodesulfobacteriota bacterium]
MPHYEFEELKEKGENTIRYRYEDCGALIEWDGPGTEHRYDGFNRIFYETRLLAACRGSNILIKL